MIERKAVGGCFIANEDVARKMGRIMLRYRPIAPKPSTAGAAPAALTETTQARRAKKRQCGSGGVGRRGRKSRKLEAVSTWNAFGYGGMAPVVTLPLMPETPERKEKSQAVGSPTLSVTGETFFWRSWERRERAVVPIARVLASTRPMRAVAVSITVQSILEAWILGIGGGTSQDDVLRRWLHSGDCPAFVSNAEDQVTWTNNVFRWMVLGGGVGSESPSSSSSSYSSTSWFDAVLSSEAATEEEVGVILVTRDLVPCGTCRAFTCMTSVRYACHRRGKVSLAVPCDVWRLEDGSLAWRLDVKAALSLSSGN